MPKVVLPEVVLPKVVLGRRAYFSAGRVLARAALDETQNREIYGRDFFPHGHDYIVTVFYAGEPRQSDGMIVNLSEIKPIMARVLDPLDGAWLNDLPAFETQPPTLENLVNFLWPQFPASIENGFLARLCVQQTSHCWIQKTPDSMKLSRQYEFAAAHRLHAPSMSESENSALYGKCNNPRGHGHNYRVEVTIEGAPDENGVLLCAPVFDKIVDEEVFERFDHKHLNEDCPEFKILIPTSENLARVIFELVQARIEKLKTPNLKLAKIGLHETQKNYFEVEA